MVNETSDENEVTELAILSTRQRGSVCIELCLAHLEEHRFQTMQENIDTHQVRVDRRVDELDAS